MPFEMKEEWEMYPTVADSDEIRVWKIIIHFKDGTSRVWEDENAFWGTGAQARAVAEDTAFQLEHIGKPVKGWETEQDENG